MAKRFTIAVDIAAVPETVTEEFLVEAMALAVQGVLFNNDTLATKIDIKAHAAAGSSFTNANGKPGRKPINRPKIEAWIRENVPVGDSTQGTTGLNGVDRQGKPLIDAPNRVYPHRLAAPIEAGGVGLSLLAIDKVLKELDVEGYLEKGFASGSPFYEYIKPLHPEGWVPGNADIKRASIREVDFSNVEDN
jgi:hypothetical protein